jgi:transcription factor E2F7/8
MTLVTPTPKKQKLEHSASGKYSAATKAPSYSRKKKSLGILAENFLNSYQNFPKGSTIVVDEAAIKLGVERRRIYDVVNILESICLVCKKHKNTYTWMGMEHLDAVFGRLQSQAIAEYPDDAEKFLGSRDRKNFLPVPLKPPRKQSKTRENKSLAKLSQEFLQVFLVGHETLSLPEASDKIQGATSMEELIAMGSSKSNASTKKELKAAAARGLKTKIRRLYDIANVFLSVGLLKKVDSGDSSRRPNFSWSYKLSAKDLYMLHCPIKSTTTTTEESTPIPVMKSKETSQDTSYSDTETESSSVVASNTSSASSSPDSK